MYRIYFVDKKIVVYDKPEKEFKVKYGNCFEQISIVKDQDNIDNVTKKLLQQYKASEIILDCKIKKKFGWKYFTEEMKESNRKKLSEALKNKVRSQEHCKAISEGKKGMAFFTGKHHSQEAKEKISKGRQGRIINTGKKWAHNPITGHEKFVFELPEGYIYGRSPESNAIITRNLKKAEYRYKEEKLKALQERLERISGGSLSN